MQHITPAPLLDSAARPRDRALVRPAGPAMSEHIEELRRQYPTVSDGFWELMAERNQLYNKLSELRDTIAHLVGWHEGYAERTGNTDLAALVGELRLAIGLPVNDGERAL